MSETVARGIQMTPGHNRFKLPFFLLCGVALIVMMTLGIAIVLNAVILGVALLAISTLRVIFLAPLVLGCAAREPRQSHHIMP